MSDQPQILLGHYLKTLKLPIFLREYPKIARQCATEGVDYERFLLRLAEQELIDRGGRMIERRIKQAKFPTIKSLDSFDFKTLPSLNKKKVTDLARCEYIDSKENIIALGNLRNWKNTYCHRAWPDCVPERTPGSLYEGFCSSDRTYGSKG